MRTYPLSLALLSGLTVFMIVGCGTLEEGRGWGQDAIYPISWDRVKSAARDAVLDPVTWVPAAGALVFAIDDFDHRVSDWAVGHNPVFGSEQTAEDVSDYARDALLAEGFFTALVTPSGDDALTWTYAKTKGMALQGAALWATSSATDALKDATGRTRPNQSNNRSFPSAHASAASSSARLANRNLESIDLHPTLRRGLQGGNLALATTVAWARVEAQKHYPSDVLAGAALGNLITAFIHDAFINLPENGRRPFDFYVEPSPHGFWGALSWEF